MRRVRKLHMGFTLYEVAAVLAILALLYGVGTQFFGPALARSHTLESRETIRRLKEGLVQTYRVNATTVDSVQQAEFRIRIGTATVVLANNTTSDDAATAAVVNYAKAQSELAGSAGLVDASQQPLRFFVSTRQTAPQPGGYTVFYRKLAIVGVGPDGVLNVGTGFNVTTGELALAGDDIGDVVDGFHVQRPLYELSIARVNKLADAYQKYFQNRFLANPTRDLSINYFAHDGTQIGRWDSEAPTTSKIKVSGGSWASASSLNMQTALGFAASDLLDAHGNALEIDNTSTAVRSPANPDPLMALPNYTAHVRAMLPGSQPYVVTATGVF
jgi:Tfp pilus assembly protein PilE